MEPSTSSPNLNYIEKALLLLFVLILLYNIYAVLGVFLGVFTYAIILSVSFYSLFEKVVARFFKGKRKLASTIYAILAIVLIAVPLFLILSKLAGFIFDAQQWISGVKSGNVPPLREGIKDLPVIGERIAAFWVDFSNDPEKFLGAHRAKIISILGHLLSGGLGILGAGFEIILGIIISAIILAKGSKTTAPIYSIMNKLVGEETSSAIIGVAGRAIKGVSIGVMGNAFLGGILGWIGFTIAGIKIAAILAALTFFLMLIQVGPLLVILPVAIWLGSTGQTGMTIFFSIYGIVVLMGVDNILKPILIGKSGQMPVLVLFLGVVGGMSAWGFTGMFKGAIMIAIFYTIFQSWLGIKQGKEIAPNPEIAQ
ncbi:AI-2E family transporter [Flavihumibacter profundi]|uniref:AI-2E family transporter n=1 Tax=Flavihumibacter profundi TaxID=2716883 RepID=UPI001CC820BD|nr:AI-2E family transporter [Flavihumibacter profundi]MBZ5859023.1 AI-2E family transporter [Flavihumibacter profundi]